LIDGWFYFGFILVSKYINELCELIITWLNQTHRYIASYVTSKSEAINLVYIACKFRIIVSVLDTRLCCLWYLALNMSQPSYNPTYPSARAIQPPAYGKCLFNFSVAACRVFLLLFSFATTQQCLQQSVKLRFAVIEN